MIQEGDRVRIVVENHGYESYFLKTGRIYSTHINYQNIQYYIVEMDDSSLSSSSWHKNEFELIDEEAEDKKYKDQLCKCDMSDIMIRGCKCGGK